MKILHFNQGDDQDPSGAADVEPMRSVTDDVLNNVIVNLPNGDRVLFRHENPTAAKFHCAALTASGCKTQIAILKSGRTNAQPRVQSKITKEMADAGAKVLSDIMADVPYASRKMYALAIYGAMLDASPLGWVNSKDELPPRRKPLVTRRQDYNGYDAFNIESFSTEQAILETIEMTEDHFDWFVIPPRRAT